MFVINVLIGEYIVHRAVFDNIQRAAEYAINKSREKVWKLSGNHVYYGNVESRVYDITTTQSSDHEDEHILSFFGSV